MVRKIATSHEIQMMCKQFCGLDKVADVISRLSRKMMTSSTLVETVSIDYEDFNESFLTCGTCLCTYDGDNHNPKLLPCSHTVCRSCLERIVAGSGIRDSGSFRCPICRETIPLPRGGVNALPPSFIVNQLLDLMSRQRREVIPKCSNHPTQELLFCETCDCIFCSTCTTGTHGNSTGSCEHTVIPFSIAIKRMSEILLYKTHLCINKLNKASEIVENEIRKLDISANTTKELIDLSFQEISNLIDKRKQELIDNVKKLSDDKKRVLQEQLNIIEGEKEKVEEQCNGLQYQVEVRNITNKISELNDKIDSVENLMEPRENAFLAYDYQHNNALGDIRKCLEEFGCVRTSTTFPALCTCIVENCSAHLETSALVQTVDYHGRMQTGGGDPIIAELHQENGDNLDTRLDDRGDGTYQVWYTPTHPGSYKLQVTIFGRPIKENPFNFSASEHIDPLCQIGSRGSGDSNFLQPVAVVCDRDDQVYVLDTGNSRIKMLDSQLEFVKHIEGAGLENRGAIGLCTNGSRNLYIVNWRTKMVTEISTNGELIKQITHSELVEPIGIAVTSKGDMIIADNGTTSIVMLDSNGKLLRKVGKKGTANGQFTLISCVGVGPNDEILVADSRIQVFNNDGHYLRTIFSEGKGKGRYGGICYDGRGNLLATRAEKTKSYIQVFDFVSGQLKFVIDSFCAKLKRPTGLSVNSDYCLFVVDLGNDCIKKYRYR